MESALIVFAKPPEPGRVKTRLTTVLSPTEAARLYRAFVQDALDQYAQLPADVRLYLSPTEDEASLGTIPPTVECFEQKGPTLGARMRQAFADTLAAGYERTVIIGTDHPTLPSAFITEAFRVLTSARALCLGPSTDGGYYLLGMSAFYPEVFEEMEYSHDTVFAETLARAARTDAQLTILPLWYDVDTPNDLKRMQRDLVERPDGAPRTRAVLAALEKSY